MGRHSKPRVTLRKVAAGTAAAGGLTIAMSGVFTGVASADPILGNCGQYGPGSNANPEVNVCQDLGYRHGVKTEQGNRIHALVKVDPLACVHVVVDPQGNRRLVGTQSCDHRGVPVIPVAPGEPACVPCPTNPCDNPAPAVPVFPAVPETPAAPVAEGPGSRSPVEAPAPQIVDAHLPVTH